MAFFGNDLTNRHYHFDRHGNLISHVHFHDNSDGKDHQHSDEDYFWLDMMSNQMLVLPSLCVIDVDKLILPQQTENFTCHKISEIPDENTSHHKRGPPVIIA
jgi:hypothetical protein